MLHQQQKVERNKKKFLGAEKVFEFLKSGKRDLVYNQMVLTARETKEDGVRASGSSGSPVPGPKEKLYQCGRGRGGGDSTAKQSAGLWAQMGTYMQRRVKDYWTERRTVVLHQTLSAWCHKGNEGDMLAGSC